MADQAFQAEKQRIADEANRKRSKAAKGNDNAAKEREKTVVQQSVVAPVDHRKGAQAKATASKDLYLRCYTAEEIGGVVGLTHQQVTTEIQALQQENSDLKKSAKVTFSEESYTPPIYNVWAFGKKTNETSQLAGEPSKVWPTKPDRWSGFFRLPTRRSKPRSNASPMRRIGSGVRRRLSNTKSATQGLAKIW